MTQAPCGLSVTSLCYLHCSVSFIAFAALWTIRPMPPRYLSASPGPTAFFTTAGGMLLPFDWYLTHCDFTGKRRINRVIISAAGVWDEILAG